MSKFCPMCNQVTNCTENCNGCLTELKAELKELENWTPEFNSEEYDAGNDRYFYELEARDARIEELRNMLEKFN